MIQTVSYLIANKMKNKMEQFQNQISKSVP